MVRERMKKAVLLCVCFLAAVSVALAAFIAQMPASAISEKDVKNDFGILVGQSKKLVFDDGSTGKVKWSSSNEKVISCDRNGKIKGVSEGSAVITAVQGEKTQRVTYYCAKKLKDPESAYPDHWLALICSSPSVFGVKSLHISLPFMSNRTSYNIIGTYDEWFYVSYNKGGQTVRAFMLQYAFSGGGEFKRLSRSCLDAFCGEYNDNYNVTTDYKGKVVWRVADPSIARYNEETGNVYGLKPGVTTISATANGKTLTCVVRVIYHWKKSWQTKLISSGDFYVNSKDGLVKEAVLAKGASYFICGDMGTQDKDGWVYGSATVNSKERWGYIKINAVSQKGTVSQYRGLNWLWPVKRVPKKGSPTYISSPYGERDTNPSMHKGMDITTGTAGEIEGYPAVAAFDGTVKKVYNTPNKDYGYAVAIESDSVDPVSGKTIVAIYMHFESKSILKEGSAVKKGAIVGYVGNTTNYSGMGYHLHFEANNQGAVIGDKGRQHYRELINPLFFYDLDAIGGKINPNSDAVKKYYGAYWYGYD